MQRVVNSATFQRSPRLRELLLHLCDRGLQNKTEELREQQIGCAVFGRKPDYSPGEDNIVRVEVRQLRKRLEEYFALEGRDDPFVIVIPKGAYVPVFEPRGGVSAETPAEAAAATVSTGKRRVRWGQVAAGVAIVGLIAACVVLWRGNRELERRVAASVSLTPERSALWPLLFNERESTFVVCADSALVVAQILARRQIGLEEYLAREYQVNSASAEAASVLRILPNWQFTDLADVRVVQRLYKLNAGHWNNVSIRTARTTQIQDFKNGSAVILGSVRSNPWNRMFEPVLNFQFEFDNQTRTPFIRNKKPLAGEEAVYKGSPPGKSGVAYSTISLVPNLRRTGNVLIIAGTTGDSTEATGEFITDAEASRGLLATLVKQGSGRIPYFEVLLKSGALAGVSKHSEVVAVRILPPAEAAAYPR